MAPLELFNQTVLECLMHFIGNSVQLPTVAVLSCLSCNKTYMHQNLASERTAYMWACLGQ